MQGALILHDIRSIHNVGSLFRTADAAGVSRLFLTGYTPGPVDRFGRARSDLAKVALGAEKTLPWEQAGELETVTERLRREGFLILALEQAEGSVPLFDFMPTQEKLALILGNETEGLSPQDLGLADRVLEIPMQGAKESLNVSVAGGIALFELLRPRRA